MTANTQEETALKQLGQEPARLLDIIDELRDLDLERLVELPQLIVCGNQSCGKSSTLEAISRVNFPVGSGVCTRFPIEVIIRKHDPRSGRITIRPGKSRVNEDIKKRLREFSVPCSSGADLPAAIESAKERMGIAQTEGINGGFCDDVLEVRISGKQDITLVDLPGLYGAKSKEQGAEGIDFVRDLMKQYMSNKRSIILAIVSAKYNYHIQEVLDRAEEYDRGRERTLAIITHPDRVESNSEEERDWIEHAKNERIKLRLGWHVLRNRAYGEKDTGNESRDSKESEFFSQGKWARLPRECIGVESLRHRLGKVLLNHISLQLPELIDDIKGKIQERRSKLLVLGEGRSTVAEQRKYLVEKSGAFQLIADHAVNGMYIDTFFSGEASASIYNGKRLRAVIRNLNGQFATTMRLKGCKRQIIGDGVQAQSHANIKSNLLFGTNSKTAQPSANPHQPSIKRVDLEKDIREKALLNRGLELPGCPNPILVGDLFREQVEPWEKIAHDHLMTCWNTVENFVVSLLEHLTDESTSRMLLHAVLLPKLETMKSNLLAKLEELTRYHKTGHLLPFDETFLSSLSKIQMNRHLALVEQKLFKGNSSESGTLPIHEVREALKEAAAAGQGSNDQYAASETIDLMEAYYNISITTFIDNVAILAIENCLMQPLKTIFTPLNISGMSGEEIERLATEPGYVQTNRQQLKADLKQLEDGLRICEQYNTSHSYLRKANEGVSGNKLPLRDLPASDGSKKAASLAVPSASVTPSSGKSSPLLSPQSSTRTRSTSGTSTTTASTGASKGSGFLFPKVLDNPFGPDTDKSSSSKPLFESVLTPPTSSHGSSTGPLGSNSDKSCPSSKSGFGSSPPASTAAPPSKGLFGNAQPTTGGFGTAQPSTGLFGAAKPSIGAFGTAQPSTGLFGSGSTVSTGKSPSDSTSIFSGFSKVEPTASSKGLFADLSSSKSDSGVADTSSASKSSAGKSPRSGAFSFG